MKSSLLDGIRFFSDFIAKNRNTVNANKRVQYTYRWVFQLRGLIDQLRMQK